MKTPSIPITLKGERSFDFIALLDSGADVSAIPEVLARQLGMDMHNEPEFVHGVGGKVQAIESKIQVIIERRHERYRFQIPINIILGDEEFPLLLGRAGFFDKFRIEFNQAEEKISLKYTST